MKAEAARELSPTSPGRWDGSHAAPAQPPDPQVAPLELSVVIPVRNEAGNVLALLDELDRALDGRRYEIIFVDDASDDDTLQLLTCAQAQPRSWLRVVRLRSQAGQSAAIRVGVLHARSEWVATLDGDGQNDPADIPALIDARDREANASGPVMVCGVRTRREDSMGRRFASRVANSVRRALLNDGNADTGCGLKLFSAQAFRLLPAFDHMHRFLPALMQRDGGRVVTVAVNHRARIEGQSKYGVHNRLWVGIIDLLGVMWLKRRRVSAVIDTSR